MPFLKQLFSRFILTEEDKSTLAKSFSIVAALFVACILFGGFAILLLILLSLF